MEKQRKDVKTCCTAEDYWGCCGQWSDVVTVSVEVIHRIHRSHNVSHADTISRHRLTPYDVSLFITNTIIQYCPVSSPSANGCEI